MNLDDLRLSPEQAKRAVEMGTGRWVPERDNPHHIIGLYGSEGQDRYYVRKGPYYVFLKEGRKESLPDE